MRGVASVECWVLGWYKHPGCLQVAYFTLQLQPFCKQPASATILQHPATHQRLCLYLYVAYCRRQTSIHLQQRHPATPCNNLQHPESNVMQRASGSRVLCSPVPSCIHMSKKDPYMSKRDLNMSNRDQHMSKKTTVHALLQT